MIQWKLFIQVPRLDTSLVSFLLSIHPLLWQLLTFYQTKFLIRPPTFYVSIYSDRTIYCLWNLCILPSGLGEAKNILVLFWMYSYIVCIGNCIRFTPIYIQFLRHAQNWVDWDRPIMLDSPVRHDPTHHQHLQHRLYLLGSSQGLHRKWQAKEYYQGNQDFCKSICILNENSLSWWCSQSDYLGKDVKLTIEF